MDSKHFLTILVTLVGFLVITTQARSLPDTTNRPPKKFEQIITYVQGLSEYQSWTWDVTRRFKSPPPAPKSAPPIHQITTIPDENIAPPNSGFERGLRSPPPPPKGSISPVQNKNNNIIIMLPTTTTTTTNVDRKFRSPPPPPKPAPTPIPEKIFTPPQMIDMTGYGRKPPSPPPSPKPSPSHHQQEKVAPPPPPRPSHSSSPIKGGDHDDQSLIVDM
ncbi:hypothetical protein ACFE04_031692 [Oxalis oulophora]